MNGYFMWFWITVIAVFAIGIGFLVLQRFLQDRDAKRQLEGKESFREFKSDHLPEKDDGIKNNDFEIEKDRMRSQNLPHF